MAAGVGKFSISDSFMHSDTGAFREKFNFKKAFLDLGSLRDCFQVHSKVLDSDVVLIKFYILGSHRLLLVHSQVPMNVALNFRNFSFCMVHFEVFDDDVVLRNFYILARLFIATLLPGHSNCDIPST